MNPLLQRTQDAILQKVDPRLVPVVKKLVDAGKQVMYSEKTRKMTLQQLGDGKDPEKIGAGIAKLIGILYSESKKTAPIQALVPAGVLLMCEGLDFLEQAGAVKVTPDFLSQCTMAMGSNVAQLFGATPDKLQGMMNQVKQGQGGAAPGSPASAAPAAQPSGLIAQARQGAVA